MGLGLLWHLPEPPALGHTGREGLTLGPSWSPHPSSLISLAPATLNSSLFSMCFFIARLLHLLSLLPRRHLLALSTYTGTHPPRALSSSLGLLLWPLQKSPAFRPDARVPLYSAAQGFILGSISSQYWKIVGNDLMQKRVQKVFYI